ncbi:RNA polymerase sigma factor SigF [Synechococcus sp. H55.9]|uniref:RNA polymerase sigma factor SigF n=2 Tax=unclassified Synechococcus TaxID=2626047 RepID=UPI0039C2E605
MLTAPQRSSLDASEPPTPSTAAAPLSLTKASIGDTGSRAVGASMASKHEDVKAQTAALLRLYHQTRDPALRNRLVEMNLGLVRKEAHHWSNQCNEGYDDLVQIGCLGLIQAIERFDITRGLAFSSFAMPYIRGEIQHYLRDKSSTLRIPRRWTTLQRQAKKVIARLRQELGRPPSEAEVREALQLTDREWQEMELAQQNSLLLSLDAPIQTGEDSVALGEVVPDQRYRSFQLAEEDRIRLQHALAKLEERTRQILEFVFFYDLTQKETAERLGISAVTVSRQVKKGLERLAKLLNQDIF